VHQLRIECKKLRYLMEFFAELIPAEAGAVMLKMLRRLQNRLGEFNDASVQQQSLLDFWAQKGTEAEIALGVGGLVAILYHRQRQTLGLVQQALAEFCGSGTARVFKHSFKRPASLSAPEAARSGQQ
jgi:CHAD domain-containing protein